MSDEATQDTGSQEVAAEATEAPVSFVDSLDESLRSNPSLQNFADANALAKSYVHARSHIGADKIVKPQSSWTDDQYNEFYAETGRPEKSEDYDIKINTDDSDAEAWNSFRNAAHGAGLNGNQAQKMAEYLENTFNDVDQKFDANVDQVKEATRQELQQEFGQALEQKGKLAYAAAGKYIDTELLEDIVLQDGRSLGDHPEIIKMFVSIASDIGEDTLVGEATELIMTPEEAMSLAKQKMKEGVYQDKFHPQHDEAVKEVQRLFELASG
nr:putative protease [uncultured Mediterranean phage uvMED]